MIEEFKKGGFTLYAGRWPIAPAVGPIRSDGSVLDEKGVLRFQVIDDELYAANSLLVGKIDSVGKEWIVADEKTTSCIRSDAILDRNLKLVHAGSVEGRGSGDYG